MNNEISGAINRIIHVLKSIVSRMRWLDEAHEILKQKEADSDRREDDENPSR